MHRPVAPARTLMPCILIVAVLSSAPGRAEAQGRKAHAPDVPQQHLTAPTARKVSAIMRDWNPVGGLGALLFGTGAGMSEKEFKKLPEREQARIVGESRRAADAKEEEGRKSIEKLLVGSLDQRVTEAERMPALKSAIGRAGLSTRDFVVAFVAYHAAMDRLQGEEMKAYGESTPALPPGVLKDNVDLLRPIAKSENLWTYLGG